MTISNKTRKNLWGKSGNRCAICKTELFSKKDAVDNLNIGEECHIISEKKNGPRYVEGLTNYDKFENLILLCRNHHIEIDTLINTYTEEVLRYMKTNHENWVNDTLSNSVGEFKYEKARFIQRIVSGKLLMQILTDCHGYRVDYDEQEKLEENEYIGGVLQSIKDYGDLLGSGMEQYEKIKIATELKIILKDMETHGYFLFAERNSETIDIEGMKHENWQITTIIVKNSDSEEIIVI